MTVIGVSTLWWHACPIGGPTPNSNPETGVLECSGARHEGAQGQRIRKQDPRDPDQRQIPRILDLGRRLLHPRGQGRAEIQGLHPPAHLHQAPLRRLRRRAEPHRRRGRLAQEGLPARQGRPQARPLLPAAGAGRSRAARLVRHPQARRQDRRRRHHPHAGHRPGKPAPAGHHRPRRLQRHHPRPARPRRRPPLQPHRGHQHQAPRAGRRRGRHHRQELRIPDPQVRRGRRPERRRVLHPARGRHHHVPRPRSPSPAWRSTTPPAAPAAC